MTLVYQTKTRLSTSRVLFLLLALNEAEGCSILELVRTHFGKEISPRKFGKAAEPRR